MARSLWNASGRVGCVNHFTRGAEMGSASTFDIQVDAHPKGELVCVGYGDSMNRESYNAVASQWAAVRTELSASERSILARTLDGVARGACVLDLGCGTGRPIAEYLVAHGLQVTGVDQSIGMLEIARLCLPEQRWVLARLEDYQPTGLFHAVVLWDSLFHIERSAHALILHRARSVMPVGSRIALTSGGTATNTGFTDMMFDHTFYYDSHPPAGMLALLEQEGFAVDHVEVLNVSTSGRDKGRIAVVARAV
jgi:SAM-dependent methyltransferase